MMVDSTAARELIRTGDLAGALARLQSDIRSHPQDGKLRVFLFQLLCVMGQWQRALSQLEVASQLDVSTQIMMQTYREAIVCESLRTEVFAGKKVPLLFGEPEAWTAMLIEALLRDGREEHAAARELRDQAFEQAPAASGHVDGQAFDWIADADMRLGPVLEAIVNGRYYWIPFSRLTRIDIEAPEDLRDLVWAPAHLDFENGGETVALIPSRYSGSELVADPLISLSRKTDWEEVRPGFFIGRGQRLFTTSAADKPLLEIRRIAWGEAAPDTDSSSPA
jgi:type VI secretion system protein ImpE